MTNFNEAHIPRIHMDPNELASLDFDLVLMSKYDEFYRRIVEYVLSVQEGGPQELLAVIVDNDGIEYEMMLEDGGYDKSLNKAMDYFKIIEEYETCDLIKQLINNL